MLTKICKYCGKEKPLEHYEIANVIKGKEYRRLKCRRCYQDTKNIWRKNNKDWIDDLKKEMSCKKCGISDYRILDFHHRESQEKEICIANSAMRWSKEKISKEIEKCDILCANCHRIFHWEEKIKNRV
jgi:hypothetical protein